MRFCVLGSGSRGNSTYVEAGSTRILIDAGFSGVEVQRRLAAIGVAAADLSAIVITHEHGDHVHGAGVLSRKLRIPVYINEPTLRAAAGQLKTLFAVCEFATGESFAIDDLRLHPFAVSHDAADPVGFVIRDSQQSCLGYCTDTGVVSRLMQYRLAACQGLVLECNHDPVLLQNGPYSAALKQRVRSKSGHLANGDALAFLDALLHDGLRHVVLAHISETNNDPQAITDAIRCRLADHQSLPAISLARQDRPGALLEI